MSSGGGSGSTPNTPNSTTLPPISPVVSLLHQSAGLRYPQLFTVQGGPLVYSPTMFGPLPSWRPIGATSTPVTSSSITSTPNQNAVPAGLTQVPQGGLVYPAALNLPMVPSLGKQKESRQGELIKRVADGGESVKRKGGTLDGEPTEKRPRHESIPTSPSLTSSPSSHPGTPPHTHKPADNWVGPQRSPVIKILYPGQTVFIPNSTPNSTKSSTPQSVIPPANIIPMSPHPPPMARVPEPHYSSGSQSYKSKEVRLPPAVQLARTDSSVTHLMIQNRMSPRFNMPQLSPPTLPNTLHLVLFKCLGQPPDSVLNHPNITVSSQLQDLYKQSHSTSSTNSDPLTPESACSLTICYFNSLRPGETINVENLRTMLQYAQQGEADWIQYHRKHKKMSESTFVQSQLFHLSRVAVYPLQGRVQVMTSHHSLGEGLVHSLYHLQYIVSGGQSSLPEFVVVMSVHPSATSIEFCVLMVEPLQVLRMREAELMGYSEQSRRRQHLKTRLMSPPLKVQPHLSLSSEVITAIQQFEKSLKGTVQLPFYSPDESLSEGQRSHGIAESKAEGMIPVSPYIIEHKPTGPFQEQCNMAAILRQKILSSFSSEQKFEHFKKVDFRVLSPPDANFVSQTVSEIFSSGLVEYIEAPTLTNHASSSPARQGLNSDLDFEAEARRRVVCCNLASDANRFQALLNDIQSRKDTLFLVIVENAHLTTKIATKTFLSVNSKSTFNSEHSIIPTSDYLPLLCNSDNCVILNVSSHPYSLQTSLSLVSPTDNQVHWPPAHLLTSEERQGSQFCSIDTFLGQGSGDEKQMEFGVSFREDQFFEELFHKAASKLNQNSTLEVRIASLRAQLLLEQYILSLLTVVGQAPPTSRGIPQPETLALVTRLVKTPLLNRRGEGTMLLIRSHDVTVGLQFYRTLKATRDSLGLQYRFEVIFDDGSHLLSLSRHFLRRIPQKSHDGHVTCYKELEGIPCVVVLAGPARAGLTFPSSLCGVDLRLCYHVSSFSRTAYEYDLSFLNGHYKCLKRGRSDAQDKMDTNEVPLKASPTEEVDSVFESNTHSSPHTVTSLNCSSRQRSSSSSSSRKSSICDDANPKTGKSESTVISWRPVGDARTSGGSSASSMESISCHSNEHPSPGKPQDSVFSSDGTLTVTIDPPCDDGQFYSGTDLCKIPFTIPPVEEAMEWHVDSVEAESDSEEEDGNELMKGSKVCLLSRSYYHVWSSQNKQQHLLLPPAPGVIWSGGHKRPPLFDLDPQNQSLHYFKWTKPASGHERSHLDSVIKSTTKGAGRRFLLTGPPQVGKTGVWHLLVRMLHDHLHSLKGVVIETNLLTRSIFVQDNSTSKLAQYRGVHSKVVMLDYLATYLCNGIESDKILSPPSRVVASNALSLGVSTATISTSPYMAYDVTHSCNDCANLKKPIGQSSELISHLPLKGGGLITIKWHVPLSLSRHCTTGTNGGVKCLEMLKLPHINRQRDQKATVKTPVFIISLGRDLTGLLNLFHTDYQQLQVVVTVESQFEQYCKAWPNLIIMALSDQQAMGLGSIYHIVKTFAGHNYQLNIRYNSPTHTTWPVVALMSDNLVMWKRVIDKDTNEDITMSEALITLESSPNFLEYAAISVPYWCTEPHNTSALTDFDLTHDFIMLNLTLSADLWYSRFSFNSADTDFNLALRAAGLRTKLCKDLAIVKKHIPTGGNMFPLHSSITSLCPDLDRVAVSLHHDSSFHLPHPGPYLMEHYLLHKSHSLFPHALLPNHPVLVIDNYVTLGPKMHVTVIDSSSLEGPDKGNSSLILPGGSKVRFGGLLLYLCEGKLTSEQISKLGFVPGACLCLVTRDCKTLVQEVGRLDLEEKWKFRLRDQLQTACSDRLNPLFFLIGRYEG